MADRYLLESGAPDGYLLEDGSGVLLLDNTTLEIVNHANTSVTYQGSGVYRIVKTGAASAYDASAVSLASISGTLRLQVIPRQADKHFWIGLNDNATALDDQTDIEQSLFFNGFGNVYLYTGGTQTAGPFAYAADEIWWMNRNSSGDIEIRKGPIYSSATSITILASGSGAYGGTAYFDTSFFEPGGTADVMFFVPPNEFNLVAASGSYALAGSAVATPLARRLIAASTGYVLSGSAATLRVTMPVASGAYSLAGSTVNLAKGFRVVALSAGYTLSGTAVGLLAARRMAAASAGYALTGSAMTPRIAMPAASGAYALTGKAAGLLAARRMAATSASYALNGTAVTLRRSLRLSAASAAYALSGSAVALVRPTILAAGSAAYSLNGSSVALNKGASLGAGSGAYALAGSNAAFAVVHFLTAAHGSYDLSGSASGLSAQHRMIAGSGAYAAYGQPVTLTLVRTVLFHDNAPASTGIESSPFPVSVEVTPVASVGASTLFALADAIPPPAAFTLQAAIPAATLED